MIYYPWTRHQQRYEYICQMGYLTNKSVADVGSGYLQGTFQISAVADKVFAVDPCLASFEKQTMFKPNTARVDRIRMYPGSIFAFNTSVDICVGVEVFEHMIEPERFIEKLAELGEYIFLTTPLSARTKRTRNKDHFREYSSKDFKSIIGKRFTCLKYNYQMPDMRIVGKAVSSGDSHNEAHVVQMYYGRRK